LSHGLKKSRLRCEGCGQRVWMSHSISGARTAPVLQRCLIGFRGRDLKEGLNCRPASGSCSMARRFKTFDA
jgi:hypothetical protein